MQAGHDRGVLQSMRLSRQLSSAGKCWQAALQLVTVHAAPELGCAAMAAAEALLRPANGLPAGIACKSAIAQSDSGTTIFERNRG